MAANAFEINTTEIERLKKNIDLLGFSVDVDAVIEQVRALGKKHPGIVFVKFVMRKGHARETLIEYVQNTIRNDDALTKEVKTKKRELEIWLLARQEELYELQTQIQNGNSEYVIAFVKENRIAFSDPLFEEGETLLGYMVQAATNQEGPRKVLLALCGKDKAFNHALQKNYPNNNFHSVKRLQSPEEELDKSIDVLREHFNLSKQHGDNLKAVLKELYNNEDGASGMLTPLCNIFNDCVEKIKTDKKTSDIFSLREQQSLLQDAVDNRHKEARKKKLSFAASKDVTGRDRDRYEVYFCKNIDGLTIPDIDVKIGRIYVDETGRYAVFERIAQSQSAGSTAAVNLNGGPLREVEPTFKGNLNTELALNGKPLPYKKWKAENLKDNAIATADILEVVLNNPKLQTDELAMDAVAVPGKLRILCKFEDYQLITAELVDKENQQAVEAEKFVLRLFSCVSNLCMEYNSAVKNLDEQKRKLNAVEKNFKAIPENAQLHSGAGIDVRPELGDINRKIELCKIELKRLRLALLQQQAQSVGGPVVTGEIAHSIVNSSVEIKALSSQLDVFLLAQQGGQGNVLGAMTFGEYVAVEEQVIQKEPLPPLQKSKLIMDAKAFETVSSDNGKEGIAASGQVLPPVVNPTVTAIPTPIGSAAPALSAEQQTTYGLSSSYYGLKWMHDHLLDSSNSYKRISLRQLEKSLEQLGKIKDNHKVKVMFGDQSLWESWTPPTGFKVEELLAPNQDNKCILKEAIDKHKEYINNIQQLLQAEGGKYEPIGTPYYFMNMGDRIALKLKHGSTPTPEQTRAAFAEHDVIQRDMGLGPMRIKTTEFTESHTKEIAFIVTRLGIGLAKAAESENDVHAEVYKFSESIKAQKPATASEPILNSDYEALNDKMSVYRTMNSAGCMPPPSNDDYSAYITAWEKEPSWEYLNPRDILGTVLPVAAKATHDIHFRSKYRQEEIQVHVKPLAAGSELVQELEKETKDRTKKMMELYEKWQQQEEERRLLEEQEQAAMRQGAEEDFESDVGFENDDSDQEELPDSDSGEDLDDDTTNASEARPLIFVNERKDQSGKPMQKPAETNHKGRARLSPEEQALINSLKTAQDEIQANQTKSMLGFVLQPVSRDGNCFYTAVAHQLSLISTEQWPQPLQKLSSLQNKTFEMAKELRQIVSNHYQEHTEGKYVENKHIETFVRETGLVVALVRNSNPIPEQRGTEGFDECFYPWLDGKMGRIDNGTYNSYKEGQPVVRLAYDAAAKHYDSVASHYYLQVGALQGAFRDNTYRHGESVLPKLECPRNQIQTLGGDSSFFHRLDGHPATDSLKTNKTPQSEPRP